MLSRRNFLKLSGVAAAAIGTGYGTGKIINADKHNKLLRVQAFLPDLSSVKELTGIISTKLNGSGELAVFSDTYYQDYIKKAYYSNKDLNDDGKINIRLSKIENDMYGDILAADKNLHIYNPEQDFNYNMTQLRRRIKTEKAAFSFTAEYKDESIFSSLFSSGKKNVVIENEDGIFDKISLSANKELFVKGPVGVTGIKIGNNSAHIFSSCCRNGLCKHSGKISEVSSLIACAPNKILLYIEKA